jgi:hypothetical protein
LRPRRAMRTSGARPVTLTEAPPLQDSVRSSENRAAQENPQIPDEASDRHAAYPADAPSLDGVCEV